MWIKGLRCGIDNCNSTFYTIQSGRRVCKNNHVQEGLETTGDDDDYSAVGKVIRRPKGPKHSKRSEGEHPLRGIEAKELLWKSMQLVFRKQMRYLMAKCELPAEFEANCRELWACFLASFHRSGFTMSHLVALLYLATRRSNDPITLMDINFWITTSQFPYLETNQLLPPETYRLLPSDMRKHFMPSSGPGKLRLHILADTIKERLKRKYPHLIFHPIDHRFVCFQMCRNLLLPPAVYCASLRIFEFYEKIRDDDQHFMYEDIPAACAVIVAAKLYFGLDDNKEASNFQDKLGFDLGFWRDIIRKLWLLAPDYGRAEERLVYNWTGVEIDDYLSWYSRHLTMPSSDPRIRSIFPLPEIPGDLPEPEASPEVLTELCKMLYSTSPPETKGIPGFAYKIYSPQSEDVSAGTALLYNILERFLSADAESVNVIIRGFETCIRRNL